MKTAVNATWKVFLTRSYHFSVGFAAFVATLAIEKAFNIDWHDPRGLHKGHGDHGTEGGHH